MPTKPKYFRSQFLPPVGQDNRPSSTSRGYDAAWRAVRAAQLTEFPWCQIRGNDCEHVAAEVDHKRPIRQGGARLDKANLRSSCGTCHKQVTAHYRATGINELPQGVSK